MKAWPMIVAAAASGALFLLLREPASEPSSAGSARPPGEPVVGNKVFWTTPGLEPDTCAAAWLLTRLVSPGARVVIADAYEGGVPFDVPGTDLGREPGKSVSDLTARRYAIRDPFGLALAGVARELELNPWTTNDEPFFSRVRSGLADALNAPGTDEECLQRAMGFLDRLRASGEFPAVPASAPTAPRQP